MRVSADSLTRLVGLAGESLVETRQLRPFVDSLLALRAAQVDLCDTIAAVERHGADAVPVVGLLGFLIGAIIAFQTYDPLRAYGATKQVADVVGISMVRELGPLIACIILAGRTAFYSKADIHIDTSAQALDETFELLRIRVHEWTAPGSGDAV